MGAKYKLGFTIIETMLFLAVTGVLIASLLAGVGGSINVQRYHDSVQSLQVALQNQYSAVINVSNQVPAQPLSCDSNANVSYGSGPSSEPRGQGDCVLMGQYITTSNNTTLTMSPVVGYIDPNALPGATDLATLQNYKLNILSSLSQNYPVEWGAAMQKAGSSNSAAFSILILRSPVSGIVMTFIDPNQVIASGLISTMVESTNLTTPLKVCLDSGGLFNTAKRMAVMIVAGATSSSGVETLGDASSGC